jgi:CheY-like chemotaxis protein
MKPTVLCVDDQLPNLRIRTMLLEQFGCNTLVAEDHLSALRALDKNQVDLVIIDYHLAHGETGEEVARDIRIMHPHLPLIMLTGDNSIPESAAVMVDAVVIKGVSNPKALLDLVEKLVPDAALRPRRDMLIHEETKLDCTKKG